MTLDGNTIDSMTFFTNVDGDIYPEKDLPENARKLRGFVWREDERIKTKDDIFPLEENELNEKIIKASQIEMAKENVPMKVRKETLEYDKNNPQLKPKPNSEKTTPWLGKTALGITFGQFVRWSRVEAVPRTEESPTRKGKPNPRLCRTERS